MDTLSGEIIIKIVVSVFYKGVYSERTELAPPSNKFCPYMKDPFPEEAGCAGK